MNSEHVEVLERLRGVLEHGKMGDKCLIAPDLVAAAIASLSAPQPPARMASIPESSPNGWLQAGGLLYRLTEGHRPQNRDEINVTMVHGSRDPAHCEARAAEILAMLQSQPPAEAQPDREPADWPHQDWKGMDGATAWLLINRHASGWEAVGEMMDAWLSANAEQPPSAPVGVAGDAVAKVVTDMRKQAAELEGSGGCEDAWAHHQKKFADRLDALAQQPAVAGEEIMVNAAHDVYTLPLQPSGLSSGPRFVVHVPAPEQQPAAPVLAKHQPCGCVICTCEDEQQCQGCGAKHCGNRADHPPYVGQQPASEVYVDFPQVGTAGPLAVVDGKVTLPDTTMNDLIRHARTGYVEQPAAVDSEMVKRAVNAYDEATGEGWQMPCLQGMRAALTAALAAQPGGDA